MNAATPGGTSPELDLLDAGQLSGDPELAAGFAVAAHRILAELVRGGAPLGWTDPPPADEVAELVGRVLRAARAGDGALRAAYAGRRLVGLGYWLRYARPTNRQHADLEKLAVAHGAHGRGVGRSLTAALVGDAREAGIEVLTLDARADNTRALALYRSLGFREYGRLPDFVAMGGRRYDKVFYMLDFRGSGQPGRPQQPEQPEQPERPERPERQAPHRQ
ncbi:GNAT family N-acetyltransferase [Streptomyces sp. 2133.1]|uniref:GNAT family N-acetyltransferase n=1 Tax=Streptomyces sp. 2133.1 TaxID=1881021 RepID=UPI000896C1FA|nr:GNAT family N-acetyltransferase [Streptomyces sp. 2133.1]SEB87396.1 Ribosomal protein S18 acetylase RimI [Streptomyces sp. 2133.1]